MSTRGFVPWMMMLTIYCLTVVSLVTFFTVNCGTANGTLFGDRISAAPESVAATAGQRLREDER